MFVTFWLSWKKTFMRSVFRWTKLASDEKSRARITTSLKKMRVMHLSSTNYPPSRVIINVGCCFRKKLEVSIEWCYSTMHCNPDLTCQNVRWDRWSPSPNTLWERDLDAGGWPSTGRYSCTVFAFTFVKYEEHKLHLHQQHTLIRKWSNWLYVETDK